MANRPFASESSPTRRIGETPRRRRTLLRRIRRALHPIFGPPLNALALAIVPRLYVAYMWLVWKTSRVEDRGLGRYPVLRDEHNGLVALLWHEEVFSVAW